ncbi:putative glucose-6-phosphate 1-epimerase [Hibiscus syriacus]|uniref:glucose-6-phosphate 1-epimerase n=1 Tax=Hibiscus syriacus TaxID=106335 RepID=A0A6A2YD84_HIBSY|nr:putative glucose-6-phosphate 1-epimerase [Hibiscus syriacus]
MAAVELAKGINSLEKIILRESRGSSAEVYLYGGHVTSWKNEAMSMERSCFSSVALFKPPKPIRGGIPLCFPQPSVEDMKIWPHSYEFRLRVALGPGGDLMLTSRIRNTNSDERPFTFTFAYHTYFSVSDISKCSSACLSKATCFSMMNFHTILSVNNKIYDNGDAITFEGQVDKIYLSTPTKIAILDHEKKRTLVLRKDGLPDAVVWNPWDKMAKTIPDFGDDEYMYMPSVEAAAIKKPITLKPGEEWRGRQELSAVPSSYCSGQLDPQKDLQVDVLQ